MPQTVITKISFKAKRKGLGVEEICRIEIDGEAWAAVDAEVAVRERLKVGEAISEARRASVLFADEVARARRLAVRRIAMKPRPKRELEIMLERKGFSGAAVDEALSGLAGDGYLDDGAVAARHLRKRLREGGYGLNRVRMELHQMGIAASAIEVQIGEVWPDGAETDRCLEFARSRMARYRPLDEEKVRRRFIDFLSRRGFSREAIERSIEQLESGERAGE